MTIRLRHLIATALAIAVLVPLAGCGGGDKGKDIPRAQAAAIINRLREVERRNDPLRCQDLQQDSLPALQQQIDSLPADTDSDIKDTLTNGVDHLAELVSNECNQQQTQTDTGPTQPSTPSTPSTTTEAPPTTTETKPPTDTNTPPSNTTPSNTTPSPGGTPGPTDTSGGTP
jgi:hypothetical protein